jgi:pyruvate,water dikinase
MFSDLEPLRRLAQENPAIADALRKNELPDDPAFQAAWHAYLSKHGHRGIYESDIARPRFREQPETLFAAILQPHSKRTPPPRTLTGFLTLPIWLQASRAMHAREFLRYTAMIGFERLRLALLELATQATQRGQLPDATALWLMTISEVRALDDEKIFDETFFAQRHAEIERLRAYTVPDLFHRFDDLEAFHPSLDTEPALRLSGVSLTLGTVQGKAWVLREPQTHLPLGFEKDTTILVARSVDAGWIPTFALVAGVVVETGGDLSHGSIILREIGLPAITNVRRATAVFHTGDWLQLNAAQGLVERLQPASALERIALP